MFSQTKSANRQLLTAITLGLALTFTLGACAGGSDDKTGDKSEKATTTANSSDLAPQTDASATDGWVPDAEAGISWVAPPSWDVGEERPMRAATYFAAPVGDDKVQAECRVNFFGADQGGDVESNLARWVGQMEVDGQAGVSPEPKNAKATQDGIELSIIELHGTYLERMSPMAQTATGQSGYMMLAVIAKGPSGSVFFKMTGPEATMEANREDFLRMIGSIAKKG